MLGFVLSKISLDEAQLLILLVFSLLGPERVVLSYALEELPVDEQLSLLPLELVGVSFADLLSFVAQELEDGLENPRNPDHIQLFEGHNALLPLFWL